MNKDAALKRAQELMDYYGSGKYKEMSMSTDERDTHFQGAAKLLWEKMRQEHDVDIDIPDESPYHEDVRRFIAHFLYDLVRHAVRNIPSTPKEQEHFAPWYTTDQIVHAIPDMTALPAE